jgi:lipopolysaccharide assembly outer membrane protein LptD (OstA)
VQDLAVYPLRDHQHQDDHRRQKKPLTAGQPLGCRNLSKPFFRKKYLMVQPLLKYPDPRIRLISGNVRFFNNTLTDIIADMIDTMKANDLDALSAIQIGIQYNVIVLREDGAFTPYINARFIKEEGKAAAVERSTYYDFTAEVERYKFDKIHKIFVDFNYDLKLKMQKHWLFGISINKQCWNYSISFKREITPVLTTNGVSGIIRKTIYFEVEFIPLGGIQQQYQLKTQKANK